MDGLSRLQRIWIEGRKLGKHLLRCLLALRYRPLGRTIVLAGFALTTTATAVNPQGGSALAAAVEDKHGATIHVAIEHGLLTVDLRDAALTDVLQAIAEMAPFRLTLRGDLSTLLTWSFTDVPLDKGIKRLVGDKSLVMVHAPTNGAHARLLSTVWVRAPGKGMVTIEPHAAADPFDLTHQGGDRRDDTARLRTARQLARRRDEAATDALVSMLAQDEDPVVRRIAAGGLGKIGGERAAAALKGALVDEDRSVQRRAIFELGKIGEDEAAEALAGVLSDDPDTDIRYFTARTLARLGSMAARSALEAALADPEYMVRTAAAGALAEWQRIFDHSD